MPEIVQRQMCKTVQPWVRVDVKSHSTEGAWYWVYSAHPDDAAQELICECPGFLYRGTCSHQADAFAKLCRWTEHDGPEKQTPDQQAKAICPRCGGPTLRIDEWQT